MKSLEEIKWNENRRNKRNFQPSINREENSRGMSGFLCYRDNFSSTHKYNLEYYPIDKHFNTEDTIREISIDSQNVEFLVKIDYKGKSL